MAAIRWSLTASLHMVEIGTFISQDSAIGVMKRIRKNVRVLKRFPKAGRIVPEDDDRLQSEVIVPPYRIMYKIVGNECRIKSVLDGRRDISTLINELRITS